MRRRLRNHADGLVLVALDLAEVSREAVVPPPETFSVPLLREHCADVFDVPVPRSVRHDSACVFGFRQLALCEEPACLAVLGIEVEQPCPHEPVDVAFGPNVDVQWPRERDTDRLPCFAVQVRHGHLASGIREQDPGDVSFAVQEHRPLFVPSSSIRIGNVPQSLVKVGWGKTKRSGFAADAIPADPSTSAETPSTMRQATIDPVRRVRLVVLSCAR